MSSANNSKQPNHNNTRRVNRANSPRRAALAMPPSASAAASNNSGRSVSRRSSQQVYTNALGHFQESEEKVLEIQGVLNGWNGMVKNGKLPPGKGSAEARKANLEKKLATAKGRRETARKALLAAEGTLKRARNAATQRNEKLRAKTAERSRSAASRSNNKARGIVRPKAAVLSVNESVSAIQAKSAARLQKMMADEAERVAKQIEEAREKAIRSQERAHASIAKNAKARAELEEKCASIGWRKA